MLYGIGCDLCEVARMEKSLSGAHGPAFVRRVFGPAEQAALGLGTEAEPWSAGRASLCRRATGTWAGTEHTGRGAELWLNCP